MILQAIHTKVLAPTNVRGSRIKVRASAGSMIVAWNHGIDHEQNHREAARDLIEKLGWADSVGEMISGCLPDGTYAHCIKTRVR